MAPGVDVLPPMLPPKPTGPEGVRPPIANRQLAPVKVRSDPNVQFVSFSRGLPAAAFPETTPEILRLVKARRVVADVLTTTVPVMAEFTYPFWDWQAISQFPATGKTTFSTIVEFGGTKTIPVT